MAAPALENLTEKLLSIGFTMEDLAAAKTSSEQNKISLTQALENIGRVQPRALIQALAEFWGCNAVHLEDRDIPDNIISLLPKDLATKLRVIPIERGANHLIVATGSPQNPDIMKAISIKTNYFPRAVLASERRITEALQKYYANTLDDSKLKIEVSQNDNFGARMEIGGDGTDDAGIQQVANFILNQCLSLGASDIHIEPYETELRVRLRIDGMLQELRKLELSWRDPLIAKIKIMSNMDITEKRLPQDKNMNVTIGGRPIDFRVSSCPTMFGEKLVLRILDKGSLQTDMTKLGFEEDDLKKFKASIHQPNGMVLVTGPTGSGKTVTLYSALAELNKKTDNIVTAEDPVEFTLPGINQVLIKNEIEFTFAKALKSFLRQDPDVIMVGEIRDLETAEIAMKAALTGHMVLSTLHTNSAPETITRLLNMGVESFNLVSALTCVVAQRLIRTNCKKCVTRDPEVTPAMLVELGFHPAFAAKVVPMKGTGCKECNNTGEKGRTAIHEVLVVTEDVRHAIARQVPPMELKKVCMASGMRTLRQAALMKMARGMISVKEVVAMTTSDADGHSSAEDVG
jgi:type IV pilus assembly protein PilB